MNVLRKLFVLCAVLLAGAFAAPFASAQAQNAPLQTAFATDFNQWVIVGQAPGTYTWAGTSTCQIPRVGGGSFFAFAVGTPIFVRDALNPSHNEIVTVSSVINTSSACGFTASLAYSHTSFSVLSGTGGLQEAINTLGGATSILQPTQIVLNKNWYGGLTGLPGYTSATPATIVGALVGNANVFLNDETTAPYTFSQWSGAKFAPVAGAIGGAAAPVAALGAAAGTAPLALIINGNGSYGTVGFTAGSATTTGTILTLTYPTTGSFSYLPSTCTVTSIGANAYTTGTVGCTYSGSRVVLTFTEATATLTAATPYLFRYEVR